VIKFHVIRDRRSYDIIYLFIRYAEAAHNKKHKHIKSRECTKILKMIQKKL